MPADRIETRFTREYGVRHPTSDTDGQIDELPSLAGQGVGLIHSVMPVEQIIDGMVAEAASALSTVSSAALRRHRKTS